MLGEILLSGLMSSFVPNYANSIEKNINYEQGIFYFERKPLVAIKEEELEIKTNNQGNFFYNSTLGSRKERKGFTSTKYTRFGNRESYQRPGITGAMNMIKKSDVVFRNEINCLEGFVIAKKNNSKRN